MSLANCRLVAANFKLTPRPVIVKLIKNQPLALCRPLSSNAAATSSLLLANRHPTLSPPPTSVCRRFNWGQINGSIELLINASRQMHSTPRPYVDPKFSYAYGRSNEHLIYSTVAKELERRVKEIPDEIAYIIHSENGRQVTFKQLYHDTSKICKALVKEFNIKKGDSVGVFAYNCYNWICIQHACSRIGATLTPINPSYKPNELAFVLKKGKVKCLFMPGPKSAQAELNNHMKMLQSKQILEMASKNELLLRDVILIDENINYKIGDELKFELANCRLHNWSSTQTNDGLIFKSLAEAEAAAASANDESSSSFKLEDALILDPDLASPDDLFAVYYTSGTTGQPKGACISQFTAINNTRFGQLRLRSGRPESWKAVIVTVLPMFHIFAGVLINLAPMLGKSVSVYSSHNYDIKAIVDSIVNYKCNIIILTPTILIDLLTYVEANSELRSRLPLKIVQSGGAALSPETVSRAFKTLPQLEELLTGYGSTENGSVSTFQTMHEPHETRPLTVGPPIDFTEVRIVEPKSERLLPMGERGEIQTRGHNTMIEYLDESEKTAEVLTLNRWYKSGDIGFMHPHGSIQICGRIKQLIIKGGENVYPEEVEQLIHKLHFVEDCHVVGVPDKRFGEQICAWVKLKPGFRENKTNDDDDDKLPPALTNKGDKQVQLVSKKEIIDYCKENITYFKVPKYVLFVDDFPMTPTKKPQHHIMTKRSVELLGLHDQL